MCRLSGTHTAPAGHPHTAPGIAWHAAATLVECAKPGSARSPRHAHTASQTLRLLAPVASPARLSCPLDPIPRRPASALNRQLTPAGGSRSAGAGDAAGKHASEAAAGEKLALSPACAQGATVRLSLSKPRGLPRPRLRDSGLSAAPMAPIRST
eukprot:3427564-Rhodomonas_salina.2